MIRSVSIILISASLASHTTAADYACHLGKTFNATKNFNVGPNVYASVQNNALIATSIGIGRDAWDVTYAGGLIGNWTGNVSTSDCPHSKPFQLGAFNFQTVSPPCFTNAIIGITTTYNPLAYVDWPVSGCPATDCGSFSIAINTYYVFSADGSPAIGEYDLRSVLAHEFGHVLGLHHQVGESCIAATSAPCSSNPTIDTMSKSIWDGETCISDIETGDENSMNQFYP